MCSKCKTVSLGFTGDAVPAGTHLCLVFSDEDERIDCLRKFILSGLKGKERAACFSNHLSQDDIREFLKEHGISYAAVQESHALTLSGVEEVYFADGVFDPERMLGRLSGFHDEAAEMGFSGARVIGEMTPNVETVPGGERLLEYECRVSMLLRDHPVTSVCQYDAKAFDGATIMEVLKVHPQMLVNGMVVKNPLFIEPERYLRGLGMDV